MPIIDVYNSNRNIAALPVPNSASQTIAGQTTGKTQKSGDANFQGATPSQASHQAHDFKLKKSSLIGFSVSNYLEAIGDIPKDFHNTSFKQMAKKSLPAAGAGFLIGLAASAGVGLPIGIPAGILGGILARGALHIKHSADGKAANHVIDQFSANNLTYYAPDNKSMSKILSGDKISFAYTNRTMALDHQGNNENIDAVSNAVLTRAGAHRAVGNGDSNHKMEKLNKVNLSNIKDLSHDGVGRIVKNIYSTIDKEKPSGNDLSDGLMSDLKFNLKNTGVTSLTELRASIAKEFKVDIKNLKFKDSEAHDGIRAKIMGRIADRQYKTLTFKTDAGHEHKIIVKTSRKVGRTNLTPETKEANIEMEDLSKNESMKGQENNYSDNPNEYNGGNGSQFPLGPVSAPPPAYTHGTGPDDDAHRSTNQFARGEADRHRIPSDLAETGKPTTEIHRKPINLGDTPSKEA